MTDDRSTRVFLAGPMTGCIEWNFPAFDKTARSLRRDGFEVFSPAERDRDAGFDPTGLDGTEDLEALGFDLREAMKANLAWICDHADAVALRILGAGIVAAVLILVVAGLAWLVGTTLRVTDDRYVDELGDELGMIEDVRDGHRWCTDCRAWIRATTTGDHDRWHIEQAAHADPNQGSLL